ncbi:MAG: aromatic acid exporter family protein [Bacillota bacterium]|nr:aromatic acid exporter family protein [Bacillota bacterium]
MIKQLEIPGIGLRNIKTAAAVLICLAILRMFKDYSPFYACIAAVITMQNSMNNTIKVGFNRMIGTLIGAAVGAVLTSIYAHSLILTSIGIVIVIFLTNLFKRSGSSSIACIVYLAIMVNIKNTTPLEYSIFRVIETFLGIIVAVCVNLSIAHPDRRRNKEQQA